MRPITTLAVLLASSAGTARADVPNIVTDIAPVHGLVSMVTGDIATPSMLIEPSASPHSNAMRPSVAAALQDADVVFWIGPDLSPWLEDPIETLAPDAQHSVLLSVAGTRTLSFRETNIFAGDKDDHGHEDHADEHGEEHEPDEADHEEHDDHEDHAEDAADHDDHDHSEHDEEKHDDHEGHDHSGIDPHAWLSPTNAGVWLTHIADTLSTLDPDNAATYAANADSAKMQIASEVEAAQTLMTPLQDRPFAVFHDAYHYFEDQFGLEVIGAISLRDAVPPSPAQVAEIQKEIRENSVVCVFSEPQFSDALVQTVIEGTNAKTAQLDPIGANLEFGAGFYPALIRDMTDRLVGCLQ